MSKELTNEELNSLIERSIEQYTKFLRELSSDAEDKTSRKKAGLISYWIFDYIRMLRKEKSFDGTSMLKYRRGDVLMVNFGYRIGCEFGGRHFAVVIDNNNNIKSGTISVLPLTSKKEGYKDSYFTHELQHGLYDLHNKKLEALLEDCRADLRQIEKDRITLDTTPTDEQFEVFQRRISVVGEKIKEANDLQLALEKLKSGTVVQLGQITTISKIRILNPKKAADSLNKIRLHPDDMDVINEKFKSLYLFTK